MSERRKEQLAAALLTLVPLVLFADIVAGINGFFVRDVVHYFHPMQKVFRELVLSGEFPYWNPYLSGGQPFAANPAASLFYLPKLLLLLPWFDYLFQIFPLLHIILTLLGTYALLRSMELRRATASLGALSFGLGGLAVSTLSNFLFLYAMAWLPLVCLYGRRYLIDRRVRDLALAAIFFATQLLIGEPTTVIQTGLLLGLYAIHRGGRDVRAIAMNVARVGLISIVALAISAVQTLPAADYVADTLRARGLPLEVVGLWSMPPLRLAELIHPTVLGEEVVVEGRSYWASGLYPQHVSPFHFSIYPGLLLAVAALAGVFARVRGAALFAGSLTISFFLAIGSHSPLLGLLHDLGLARSWRYPEKYILMGVFALCVFGARVVDRLMNGDERPRRAMLFCGAAIAVIAAAFGAWAYTPSYVEWFRHFWELDPVRSAAVLAALSSRGWLLLAIRAVLLLLLVRNLTRVRTRVWAALAALFVMLDLSIVVAQLTPRIAMEYFTETPRIVSRFAPERDAYRMYHLADWATTNPSRRKMFNTAPLEPRYWLSRNALFPRVPLSHGLRIVAENDYDITQLAWSTDFSMALWTLQQQMPRDWLNYVAAMANVWYVGVYRNPAQALATGNGDLRHIEPVRFIEGRHYPRYYFATQMDALAQPSDFVAQIVARRYDRQVALVQDARPFAPGRGVVRSVRETVNGARIEVEAASPAFLVMSVTAHKYWRITIDGREVPAVVTNVAFQGVAVPPGRHLVEMRYHNPLVAAGAAITFAALIALAFAARTMRHL